jgi:hypothetical protein
LSYVAIVDHQLFTCQDSALPAELSGQIVRQVL